MSKDKIATYEEVAAAKNDKNILVIDVRAKAEIVKSGRISFSINIPDKELKDVLENMTEEEFKNKYKREKPKKETEIIFYCYDGSLSTPCCDTVIELGYVNARDYSGGYSDWDCNENHACSL